MTVSAEGEGGGRRVLGSPAMLEDAHVHPHARCSLCCSSSLHSVHIQEGGGITALFMSPELWAKDPYTTGPDVWALGVMMAVLLTGVHPFDGDSPPEVSRKVREDEGWAASGFNG